MTPALRKAITALKPAIEAARARSAQRRIEGSPKDRPRGQLRDDLCLCDQAEMDEWLEGCDGVSEKSNVVDGADL